MDRYPRSNGSIVERANSGIQAYMAQVYGWMTCGLLLTAFVSWYAANTPAILNFIFSSQITFFGLIIAQLALVFVISGMVNRLSGAVATSLFMLYSALTGLTLSSIFIAYTYSSIASTFVVTAGMFGAMSLYGYTTKRDLSGFGSMLFMALIGIVLASLVNIWLKSTALMWASPTGVERLRTDRRRGGYASGANWETGCRSAAECGEGHRARPSAPPADSPPRSAARRVAALAGRG